MLTHIHPVNVELEKSMFENIKHKLSTYLKKNQHTEVYLHQLHNGHLSVGLMCRQGKDVYFSDGQDIDFENALYQALFKLKQQLSAE